MINKEKLNNLTNEIWKSAERLRGKFKAYEYQSVILPIIIRTKLFSMAMAEGLMVMFQIILTTGNTIWVMHCQTTEADH